jgi:glycosidase
MVRVRMLLCGLCLLLAGLASPRLALAQDDPAPAVFHDSRDDAFRTPGGAQPFGSQVTLRLRTPAAAADAAVVATNLAGDAVVTRPMQHVATADGSAWWEATLAVGDAPAVWNYQFQLTLDGAPAFYADNARQDGGAGELFAAQPPADQGWDIYVYDPAFTVPDWAANAVIYQIFPDRFRNGDPGNDPTAANWFYPEECGGQARPVTPWNSFVPDPEPNDPARNPEWAGTYNCTFFGGDLQGVLDQLDYVQSLGVDTLYFNPIFDAPSNHRYDSRSYAQVDGALAGSGDILTTLAAAAQERGMHLILDAVPNHTSSDSPWFDRYGRHDTVGACESEDSPYRAWYFFDPAQPAGTGTCAGDVNYRAWAGVGTLPQLDTANPAVIDSFLGEAGVVQQWLQTPGVNGLRLDAVPDVVQVNPTFFANLRDAAKAANPNAFLISETWPEAAARERVLGDEFDSTMNYRFRLAVLGFLRDSDFTEDGDGGVPALTASQFEAALRAVEEDYPPGAFAAAMNVISSHDVNRAVRVLDHDGIDYAAQAPVNGIADGRQRLGLAAALLLTLPGAPTIYYGDEVGLVGFGSDVTRDDPYNRQPYPWPDAAGYDDLPAWRQQDVALLAEFQALGQLRRAHSFLRTGSWDTFVVDDAGLYVFGRKDETGAALVAVNRSSMTQTVDLDLSGYLPYGATLTDPLGGSTMTVGDGAATVAGSLVYAVAPRSYQIWVTAEDIDLTTPSAPEMLEGVEGDGGVTITALGDDTAAQYAILRAPVDGGYQEIAVLGGTDTPFDFVDAELTNGVTYFYRVQAIGYNGLRSAPSAPVALTPHVPVQSVVMEEPLFMQHTLSAVERSSETRAAVFVPGITDSPDQAPGVLVEVGWGQDGDDFTWTAGAYVSDSQGGGDIYAATLLPEQTGDFVYRWRASTTGGRDWTESINAGQLTVYANADAEPPKPPFRLDDAGQSNGFVALGIRASRTADLHAFRVCRTDLTAAEEGCAVQVDVAAATQIYTDTAITTGHTYVYTVQAVDTAFNVSAPSRPITLTAATVIVPVTFRVLVPDATPVEDIVFIAGDDPAVFGAAYNPALQPLAPMGDNLWEWTTEVRAGTPLLYKYTRGNWETVEQWGAISGFNNRSLTVTPGPNGALLVEDTATDWGADGPDDHRAIQAWRDPLVAAVTPAPDSSGPAPDALAVEFTISVQPAGSEPVIAVTAADGAEVAGTVERSGGNTFVFTPAAPLAPGVYTATAFNVTQTTAMVRPFVWSFAVE